MNLRHLRLYYILDADNRVVPVEDPMAWARWFETHDRRVDWTQITSEITVSTVFIGIDHRFLGGGPPLVFETMVFGGPIEHEMQRYSSWDDAAAGHRGMVRKVRAAQKSHGFVSSSG